jgi:hypothetical protein
VSQHFRNHADEGRRRTGSRSEPALRGSGPGRDVEEQPVRFTLDLPRRQHRFLKRFALDAEVEASVVLRGLLELLQDDAQLAKRLRPRLPGLRARARGQK